MDKLWFFSETGQIFWVPKVDSIVNQLGEPKKGMAEFEVHLKDAGEFRTFCERSDQVILVSSEAVFPQEYLAAIPESMPRLALIKSGTPTTAREQLDRLHLDTYILGPFEDAALNSILQRSLDEKNELLALKDELKSYSDIAFSAMSSASEMGVAAFYVQAVHNISNMEHLASQTIECLSELSAQGFVQFAFADGVHVYPSDISATYRDLLEWTRTSPHRIISQGRFLIFNFDTAQFLITNAPVDDPEKYGRLRDVIAHIVSIAEARARTIKVNCLLEKQQANTRMVLSLLDMAARDNRDAVKTVMMDLSMSLRELSMGMDLTLDQETAVLALSEKALESLESLQVTTGAVESHFRSLLLQLDEAAKLLKSDDDRKSGGIKTRVELF